MLFSLYQIGVAWQKNINPWLQSYKTLYCRFCCKLILGYISVKTFDKVLVYYVRAFLSFSKQLLLGNKRLSFLKDIKDIKDKDMQRIRMRIHHFHIFIYPYPYRSRISKTYILGSKDKQRILIQILFINKLKKLSPI